MTPFSFPKEPVKVQHLECGSVWDMYAVEWPPKVTICTKCRVPLRLMGLDEKTKRLSFRRI